VTAVTGGPPRRWHRLADRLRSRDLLTDLVQIVKSVLAATLAWWISVWGLHSELPFLAPWIALLTVQVTVYRSVRSGVQIWVASAIGVGVSYLVGTFLGVSVWTFALAVLVGLVGARLPWLRTEGVAIATTAIFVLGSGFGSQEPLLNNRLLEAAIGVAVALLVNLLVAPPLRKRQAARHVDGVNRRMGEILIEMADELESSWDTDRADVWVQETMALSQRLSSVGQAVQVARESARLNPRDSSHWPHLTSERAQQRRQVANEGSVNYEEIFARLGEGIATLRDLALTVRDSTHADGRWDEYFRGQWVGILRDAGRSIHDPHADVEPVQDRLDGLAGRMSRSDGLPPGADWPVYGALITGLHRIAVIVDDVASAQGARDPSQPNPQA